MCALLKVYKPLAVHFFIGTETQNNTLIYFSRKDVMYKADLLNLNHLLGVFTHCLL